MNIFPIVFLTEKVEMVVLKKLSKTAFKGYLEILNKCSDFLATRLWYIALLGLLKRNWNPGNKFIKSLHLQDRYGGNYLLEHWRQQFLGYKGHPFYAKRGVDKCKHLCQHFTKSVLKQSIRNISAM